MRTLPTQDVLNTTVSCTANYFNHSDPRPVNLWNWLSSTKYADEVNRLRQETDKSERDKLKALLPAITPSGTFTHVSAKGLVKHSGLIQFDIDATGNGHITDFNALKTKIGTLPFVAYCGLSASAKGVWGLIPIAYPEKHTHHFNAIEKVFWEDLKITLDTKPKNVASLRGYSCDPAPYIPQRVTVFEWVHNPQQPPKRSYFDETGTKDQNRVEQCINEITRRGLFLGDSYNSWYTVGCGLANTFGESGRAYFLAISANYPGTHKIDPDKQFTACLRANSKATLGSFFAECKKVGIEWKDAPTAKRRSRPNVEPAPEPEAATTRSFSEFSEKRPQLVTRWNAPYPMPYQWDATGQIAGLRRLILEPGEIEEPTPQIVTNIAKWNGANVLRPDESDLTGLTVEPCEPYPVSWDEPPAPDAVPKLRVKSFQDFQQSHPYFSQMGLASINRP